MPDMDCTVNANRQKQIQVLPALSGGFKAGICIGISQPTDTMNVKVQDGGLRIGNDARCSHNQQLTDGPICTVTALIPGKDNGLRLVKVKVSLAELTGPVQYIYPPEMNSESAANVTAVPNRGPVPFLIHLIKAAGLVTSLGGNLPFLFAWSRLILEEESKGVKIL